MEPDDIADRYSSEPVALTVRLVSDEETEKPTMVLIEGSREALRFVGEVILSIADESRSESYSISPFGAGRIHFSPDATVGIYINRIEKDIRGA